MNHEDCNFLRLRLCGIFINQVNKKFLPHDFDFVCNDAKDKTQRKIHHKPYKRRP